ncbi:MAG: TonB-dependent receptor [Gammaproteobacteria bacterium]|nr:TonB-dependent receptor [Gammaproteobacteria bacterium]
MKNNRTIHYPLIPVITGGVLCMMPLFASYAESSESGHMRQGAALSGAVIAMASDGVYQELDALAVRAKADEYEQSRTEPGRLTEATPIAGSVITREELDTVKSADSLRELLTRVPGVSMSRNIRIPIGGKGYTNNLIDGHAVKSSSLGTYGFIDEVNSWDIESIEVVRGPGSVLHSSKGIGGTINVITRDPPLTPEYRLWGDVGEYGFRRIGANGGDTMDNGIGWWVDANWMEDDAWRDRSAREKKAASARLVMHPDALSRLSLRLEHIETYKEFPGVLTQEQFESNWRQAVPQNLFEDLTYDTAALAYKRVVGERGELDLSYSIRFDGGTNACPAGCANSVASTGRQTEIDYTHHNLRALYRHDFDRAKSRLYGGVDAFISEKNDDTYNRTGFTRTTLRNAYSIDEVNVAPFLQYEFSPAERWRVALGLRHEDYELDVDDRSPTSNVDGSESYSRLIKKGGVTFDLDENNLFWANLSQGFYIPSTSQTITAPNARPLPPETSLTQEIGVRGRMPSYRLSYDIGLFRTVVRNQAVSQPCGGDTTLCPDDASASATYAVAAGKVKFQGIESTLAWDPFDRLGFALAHTYALNRYVDFIERSIDYSENTLTSSPKHHLNARIMLRPSPKARVEFEGDYISHYYTNSLNTNEYSRPVLYNLRAEYRPGKHWELWAHALNLFDAKYGARVSATNAPAPVRSYSEGYGPRTLRVGASYRW